MKKRMNVLGHRLMLLCALIGSMFPIYWMLNTSFKTQKEVYSLIPTFLPKNFTTANFKYLLTTFKFGVNLRNSLIIAASVVIFSLLIAYPSAYSLARIKFKGKRLFSQVVLFCYLLPSAVLYIPLYIFVSRVGLTNTMWGLILIYPTFTLPFMCWVLIPHLASVPRAIEEAAIVDGCSQFGIMLRIVFPLAKPGVISSIIFSFSACWGEYLYSLVNVTASRYKTFPVALSSLIYGDLYPWGNIMAAAILGCIPIFLVYITLSRFLVTGVTAGGVKG
jgi:multiple sugar transport system permease protein